MKLSIKNYSVQIMRLLIGGAMVVSMFALAIAAPAFVSVAFAQENFSGVAGIRPANPRADNPRTDDIWVHTLDPGTTIEDGVRALNGTDVETTLLIYPVDEVISSGGAFGCRQRSWESVEVGTWITLAEADESGAVTITLPPGKEATIPFTIAVPDTAGVGEHNGCVIVEVLEGGDIGIGELEPEEGETESGIQLKFRRGVRVALLVPGEIVRSLQVLDLVMSPREDGDINFKPIVKNSGNVSIDADVIVSVTNSVLGYKIAELGGTLVVLRGTEADWNVQLSPPFWGGWYTAVLTVAYDPNADTQLGVRDESRFITITGPATAFYVQPAFYAVGVYTAVGFILLILLLWFTLTMRQKRWIKTKWSEYEVVTGDDIQALAHHYKVSWKLLAKANKVSAPYLLEAGAKLLVPPFKPGRAEKKVDESTKEEKPSE